MRDGREIERGGKGEVGGEMAGERENVHMQIRVCVFACRSWFTEADANTSPVLVLSIYLQCITLHFIHLADAFIQTDTHIGQMEGTAEDQASEVQSSTVFGGQSQGTFCIYLAQCQLPGTVQQ